MSQPWLKLWTDIIGDTKLARLSPEGRWVWIIVLTLARLSPEPGRLLVAPGEATAIADIVTAAGLSDEDMSRECHADVTLTCHARVTRYVDTMLRLGLLTKGEDGVLVVANWERRQHRKQSDNPEQTRERKAKSRSQAKAPDLNVTRVSRDVSRDGHAPGHAAVTRTDLEADISNDDDSPLNPPTNGPPPDDQADDTPARRQVAEAYARLVDRPPHEISSADMGLITGALEQTGDDPRPWLTIIQGLASSRHGQIGSFRYVMRTRDNQIKDAAKKKGARGHGTRGGTEPEGGYDDGEYAGIFRSD